MHWKLLAFLFYFNSLHYLTNKWSTSYWNLPPKALMPLDKTTPLRILPKSRMLLLSPSGFVAKEANHLYKMGRLGKLLTRDRE